jgi:xanthosine utilization system XapX-like protein
MKKTFQNLLVAMFVAASLQTHAQGFVYDQQSATNGVSPFANNVDGLYIQTEPLTQSFIPTLLSIGFLQLEFEDVPNNGNSGATVYVNLWTGSPNVNSATLLGSTTPVFMPDGFVNSGLGVAGITNFYFSAAIVLTAGQTYYLQPVVQSGDNPWAVVTIGNTYPNGQLFASGAGFNTDMWFREGVMAAPEPATLALVGFGGILVYTFKRRSKPFISFGIGALLLVSTHAQTASASDSPVQVAADFAGLTPVAAADLPGTGTFIVLQPGANGQLVQMPYPVLPPEMSSLPIYQVNGDIYLVDASGGQLASASPRLMNRLQAAATALALVGLSGLLIFGRSALPSERFFNASCALRIRRFQTIKQSVGTRFEELRQAGKRCQRNRKRAAFNVSDCFPMHAYQFSQTFLRHIGFMPRVADVLTKQP